MLFDKIKQNSQKKTIFNTVFLLYSLKGAVMSNPHFTLFAGTKFEIPITYYALCIVAGIILCTISCIFLFKRRGLATDYILELLLLLLPLGIIGARTFYVLTDPNTSITEWFQFRDGGISILGAVLGGSIGVLIFCLWRKINFLRLSDCIVPGLILAQGIGRWGNFINQEVYGQLVTNPNLQFFPFAVYITDKGQWFQALFFYEFVFNILLFIALYTFMWLYLKKPNGLATALYFLGYGVVRSIMEGMRDKEFILGNSIAASRLVSILMAIGGAVLLAIMLWLNYKKEGCLFGSKRGEPLAIVPKYPLEKAKTEKDRASNLKKESNRQQSAYKTVQDEREKKEE